MKTSKKIWHGLMILMAVLFTGNLYAQVTIGGEIPPKTYSVLELIGQYNTSPDKYGGLRLPQLTTAQRNGLDVSSSDLLANGLVIYNTDNKCIEYWNGEKWISFCNDVPEPVDPCATPPSAGTISGNNLIKTRVGGTTTTQLSTTGTLGGSWSSSNPAIATVSSTGLVRAGTEYGPVTITYTVGVDKCVSNAIYTVYIGCGAFTTSGKWLAFMCHNLGADESLDPFTWNNNKGYDDGFDIKGDLYQWGRPKDGHEKRNSTPTAPDDLATSSIPGHNNFIPIDKTYPRDWRSGSGYDSRWGDGSDNENMAKAFADPCPAGWKVPSLKQWVSIYGGSTNNPTTATGLANTWAWTGNGFKIGDALYLPGSSYRGYSDTVFTSVSGYYWSSSVHEAIGAYHLFFSSVSVMLSSIINSTNKANALSVRCVQE